MPSPAPPPDAPPDVVALVFEDGEPDLRGHAIALLLSTDAARNGAQAAADADDVLQEARLAALRHAGRFVQADTPEAQLNLAKTFVWNAVRSHRGTTFSRRRRLERVSDDARPETAPLSHDDHLARLAPEADGLADEVAEARRDLIAALPSELDRLTVSLADEGYEGQDLADAIARATGEPYSYAAATARLSRVRARLLAQIRTLFQP
jgi:DNA-directed RNA polymerase specialized sigma24 family protein